MGKMSFKQTAPRRRSRTLTNTHAQALKNLHTSHLPSSVNSANIRYGFDYIVLMIRLSINKLLL